ncbi:MAG: LysR family transcriptional regulator [Gammaproteobacteria bacterium]|nr:LysR family transcriptional regulator [Gammaproteobacteria bacterium]
MVPKVTLDQWRVLQSIIDEGGFAQAAAALHRSQSSVSYAVRRLQEVLGVQLVKIQGRRAVLTEAGRVLLDRSRLLTTEAVAIEEAARQLRQGWEPVIQLAVENVFPVDILLETLKQFEPLSGGTRIHLREEVLSGITDALADDVVDLAISPIVPEGYMHESLMDVEFIAVAHRDHLLHQQGETAYGVDLLKHAVHIVIRDSGVNARDAGWVQNEHKWTVSSFAACINMVSNGLGFAWLPRQSIQTLLDNGELLPLKLKHGGSYRVPVNLIYAKGREEGPALALFIKLLKSVVEQGK